MRIELFFSEIVTTIKKDINLKVRPEGLLKDLLNFIANSVRLKA